MSVKGKLIVISGFSGVGKGTVIARIMKDHPEFVFSVSATTRYKREGEVDGVHYFFRTREEFEEGIREDRLLEYAQYNGNYYGTPRDYVFSQMEQGNNVVLDIECQGALQVKERCPEAILIFLIPPSIPVLYRRLTGRGTETAEQVLGRMQQTRREMDVVSRYDVILENDVLEDTVEQILAVLEDPELGHRACQENLAALPAMSSDLNDLLEELSAAQS